MDINNLVLEKPQKKFENILNFSQKLKESFYKDFVMPLKFPSLFAKDLRSSILLCGFSDVDMISLIEACANEIGYLLLKISFTRYSMKECGGSVIKLLDKMLNIAENKKEVIIVIENIEDRTVETQKDIEILIKKVNKRKKCLIFITSEKPWSINKEVISTIECKYLYDFPDINCRKMLLKKYLSVNGCINKFSEDDLKELSKMSEGFALYDIRMLMKSLKINEMKVKEIKEAICKCELQHTNEEKKKMKDFFN